MENKEEKHSVQINNIKNNQSETSLIEDDKDKNKKQKIITEINNRNNDIKIYNFEKEPKEEIKIEIQIEKKEEPVTEVKEKKKEFQKREI